MIVKSRRILTNGGWLDGAIVIEGEKITSLLSAEGYSATRSSLAFEGVEIVDAGDAVVSPGLVDTHVHFRDPGFTEKEDFEHGSRAAAAGGVTTVFDMPNVDPATNTADKFKKHIENAASKSVVDFGHNASGTNPDTIAELYAAGAGAFKVFMVKDKGRTYPHMPGTAIDDNADLLRICQAVAKTGRPLFVHPHDQAIYELLVDRTQERWGLGPQSYARHLSDMQGIIVDSGIATLMQLQRVTGVRMHILHVSTVEGLRLIANAKAEGRPVSAEINPQRLFLSQSWETIEERGPYALGLWVPEVDGAAMWEAVADGGAADVLASDHSPHTKDEKEIGWENMYAAPSGMPSIQECLPLLLTEVNRGRLSLERLVTLFSVNPAQLVGLYPRKGAIAPGSDADLVVVDLERKHVLTAEEGYAKCGWSAFEGREVTGMPTLTIVRGRIVMSEGEVVGRSGWGKFQSPDEELK